MDDLKRYFRIGEKVQIDYIDALGEKKEFVSQIVNIQEEYVDILIPIYKKRDVHLKQGSLLKLVVMKEDAIYELKTVLSEKLFGSIPLLRLKGISEINKIQRRDYYRLKIFREIEVRQIIDKNEKKYGESFKGNLQDISSGGLMFSTKEQFDEKDLLEFTLDLNDHKMVVLGIVVRRNLNESYRSPYSYGIKYVDLNMADRNAINRFIFEEQRRLIKKGLI